MEGKEREGKGREGIARRIMWWEYICVEWDGEQNGSGNHDIH